MLVGRLGVRKSKQLNYIYIYNTNNNKLRVVFKRATKPNHNNTSLIKITAKPKHNDTTLINTFKTNATRLSASQVDLVLLHGANHFGPGACGGLAACLK